MDKTRQSKAYHKIKNYLFSIALLVDIAIFVVAAASGLSVVLRDFALKISSNLVILNGTYLLAFMTAIYLLHFPLRYLEGYFLEHKFGLSNQNILQWFTDDLKKVFIQGVVTLIMVEVIYVLLRQFPQTWWVGAGFFWLFITLILVRLTPNVIIPLFYKYAPIEDEALRSCVLKLFEAARIKIKDAYLINFSSKTKKANAFICGLGKSRRVVLSDTFVKEFSVPEIETVIAHEIGHYKHHDILKLTVINSCVVFFGFFLIDRFIEAALKAFGLTNIQDIASFPVIALGFTLLGFFMMPVLNGYSRSLEVAADLFSLKLTQNPKDFIGMMRKLGEMNLAEFEPHPLIEKLFYSHPPISKRIRFAEHFIPGGTSGV